MRIPLQPSNPLQESQTKSNVLDPSLDSRGSLNVQPRRKLTQHSPYDSYSTEQSQEWEAASRCQVEIVSASALLTLRVATAGEALTAGRCRCGIRRS